MRTPTVAPLAANGAFMLRFGRDAGLNLAAVQKIFPAARGCVDFRTFDGDACLQVQMPNDAARSYGFSHLAPFSLLPA